ncbi:MAG TPA: SRPBCC family protein [Fimbriimonas sp.]|nr:SRPBCC family protein [Fimbriimonas sp.]
MHQVPSDPTQAVIVGDFDAFSPDQLFDYFTRPELLTQWWPKEATVDLRVGGSFAMSWPEQNWHLRGQYLAVEPGRRLSFTWNWDHEPVNHGLQTVDLWILRMHDTGSRLGIFHGPFQANEADQEARQGVIEGWIHFGMHLGGLVPGAVD